MTGHRPFADIRREVSLQRAVTRADALQSALNMLHHHALMGRKAKPTIDALDEAHRALSTLIQAARLEGQLAARLRTNRYIAKEPDREWPSMAILRHDVITLLELVEGAVRDQS